MKTNLLSASEIRDGYSVRPSAYVDYVKNARGGYDTRTQWLARLWHPSCGWMGNVFFEGRRFATCEECQAAIDAAGGAGDVTRLSWGASGYREDFEAGRYVRCA